jgi:hypothetical protein
MKSNGLFNCQMSILLSSTNAFELQKAEHSNLKSNNASSPFAFFFLTSRWEKKYFQLFQTLLSPCHANNEQSHGRMVKFGGWVSFAPLV